METQRTTKRAAFDIISQANKALQALGLQIDEVRLIPASAQAVERKDMHPPPVFLTAEGGGGGGGGRESCLSVDVGGMVYFYCRYWRSDGSFDHSDSWSEPSLEPIPIDK